MLFRFDPLDPRGHLDPMGRSRPMLAMDATRSDDEVTIYFDVPGVDRDEIDITVENTAITVEATRRWFDPEVRTLTSERPQGAFKREIQLGEHLDVDRVDASLDRGVLTLVIPIKEGTKPRTIEVSSREAAGSQDLPGLEYGSASAGTEPADPASADRAAANAADVSDAYDEALERGAEVEGEGAVVDVEGRV